jgi:hypothetical protein
MMFLSLLAVLVPTSGLWLHRFCVRATTRAGRHFVGYPSGMSAHVIFVVNKFVPQSHLVDQFPKYLERQDILPCAGSAARR